MKSTSVYTADCSADVLWNILIEFLKSLLLHSEFKTRKFDWKKVVRWLTQLLVITVQCLVMSLTLNYFRCIYVPTNCVSRKYNIILYMKVRLFDWLVKITENISSSFRNREIYLNVLVNSFSIVMSLGSFLASRQGGQVIKLRYIYIYKVKWSIPYSKCYGIIACDRFINFCCDTACVYTYTTWSTKSRISCNIIYYKYSI